MINKVNEMWENATVEIFLTSNTFENSRISPVGMPKKYKGRTVVEHLSKQQLSLVFSRSGTCELRQLQENHTK